MAHRARCRTNRRVTEAVRARAWRARANLTQDGGSEGAGRHAHRASERSDKTEIETALYVLAVDNAREISRRRLRSRPQSSRHGRRMKFVPFSGVHLWERWVESQYVVFSGERCAPTILVRPAGQSASPRASSAEHGASSRCWSSAPPVARPRFSITKDERS